MHKYTMLHDQHDNYYEVNSVDIGWLIVSSVTVETRLYFEQPSMIVGLLLQYI